MGDTNHPQRKTIRIAPKEVSYQGGGNSFLARKRTHKAHARRQTRQLAVTNQAKRSPQVSETKIYRIFAT